MHGLIECTLVCSFTVAIGLTPCVGSLVLGSGASLGRIGQCAAAIPTQYDELFSMQRLFL
jgi:hypothetical protein